MKAWCAIWRRRHGRIVKAMPANLLRVLQSLFFRVSLSPVREMQPCWGARVFIGTRMTRTQWSWDIGLPRSIGAAVMQQKRHAQYWKWPACLAILALMPPIFWTIPPRAAFWKSWDLNRPAPSRRVIHAVGERRLWRANMRSTFALGVLVSEADARLHKRLPRVPDRLSRCLIETRAGDDDCP